jgi:hypothetical protein
MASGSLNAAVLHNQLKHPSRTVASTTSADPWQFLDLQVLQSTYSLALPKAEFERAVCARRRTAARRKLSQQLNH